MARRIPRQPLASLLLAGLLLAWSVGTGQGAEPVRIRYSFDDGLAATGPDTFTVFRNAKGSVQLSTAFHVSGYHSIEIRDVAGDQDFPELQGFFPERRDGRLVLHFALLTTDPGQELNVALAGPGWFRLGEDGIALWFKVQDGVLRHVSDSIPKKLLDVKPFTWYRFDVDYDLARGRYDLRVTEEGNPRPAVSLRNQPNGSSQPGAAVNVFSFIGDLADRSNAVYYVDDFVLTSDGGVSASKGQPFVAPGRRKFFVDRFAEQVSLFKRLRKPGSPLLCPPVLELAELGVSSQDASALKAANRLDQLAALLDPETRTMGVDASAPPKLRAAALWKSGCKALEAGRAQEALNAFEAAARQVPEAEAFALSRAFALVALKKWQELDDLLVLLHSRWRDDPRYALVSALAGAQRDDLAEARAWLNPVAVEALREAPSLGRLAAGDWSDKAVAAARTAKPEEWKRWLSLALASEQRFHLSMFEERTAEARDYAIQMAQSLKAAKVPAGHWLERAGDAAFTRRDLEEARQLYGQAKLNGAREVSVLLKLADVHFLLGDLEAEKALREAFYGSLDPRAPR